PISGKSGGKVNALKRNAGRVESGVDESACSGPMARNYIFTPHRRAPSSRTIARQLIERAGDPIEDPMGLEHGFQSSDAEPKHGATGEAASIDSISWTARGRSQRAAFRAASSAMRRRALSPTR